SHSAMRRLALYAVLLALAAPNTAVAQDTEPVVRTPGRNLDLGFAGYGISIGNSPAWTGLRVNFIDRDVRRVDGINLTLWRPHGSLGATFTGLAVGLYGPEAGTIRGAGIGIASVVADRTLRGL